MPAKTQLDNGIAQASKRDLVQAAISFRQAIELNPQCTEAYFNLAVVLKTDGQLVEAEECLERAARLCPDNPEVYFNLGVIQSQAKRRQAAAKSFQRAIDLKPDSPEAVFNLGVVQAGEQLLVEAKKCFRQAIALNPHFSMAYYNLGLVLKDEKRWDEAVAAFRRAVEIDPKYVAAYNNLGMVLRNMQQLAEAEVCLRRALEINPKFLVAYNNLSAVLKDFGRLDEAEACLRQALTLKPDYAEAYNCLGVVLTELNRLAEAKACLERAIQLTGPYPAAEFSLGMIWLLEGRYKEGWKKFELRYTLFGYTQPHFRRWQGEDLTGCKILLYHEQGFGDTIQFVRYAYMVAQLAAETVVWIREPLVSLLANSQHQFHIHTGESLTGRFDFACPLLSLPYVFNTTVSTIPQTVPYIWPSQEVLAKWHSRLKQIDHGGLLKIGVVWSGNAKHVNDRNRSVPFDQFSQLFAIPQVSWISLQVGERAEDLKYTDDQIADLSLELVDFAQTAGALANLDLVISVDTAVAHLAGAMGKPTWLLVPFAPDWRWGIEGEDCPWYPTLRLFRQQQLGDWQAVLTRLVERLILQIGEIKA